FCYSFLLLHQLQLAVWVSDLSDRRFLSLAGYRQLPAHPSPGLARPAGSLIQRFQVASDECTISRKTDSLYRRKRREQSMLHVKRVRVELRIPEGTSLRGRCVRPRLPSFPSWRIVS